LLPGRLSTTCFEGLSGTNPLDLLETAQSIYSGQALARYTKKVDSQEPLDPVTELYQASVEKNRIVSSDSSLLPSIQIPRSYQDRSKTRHIRSVKATSTLSSIIEHKVIDVEIPSSKPVRPSKVMANTIALVQKRKRNYQGSCLEHLFCSTRSTSDKSSSSIQFMHCPQRQRIAWHWKSTVSRKGPSCVLSSLVVDQKPTSPLTCHVALHGSDIFKGLQAMMDAGYIAAHGLPQYVKEAPLLGGTIHVENGSIVVANDEYK
jgi:hypothetical protein